MAPKQCGIHSKPLPLLQKTCLSYAYETLATYDGTCLRIHALDALPVDVGRDPRMQAEGHLDYFISKKSYIFHFNTP